jgi:hypothetical protein
MPHSQCEPGSHPRRHISAEPGVGVSTSGGAVGLIWTSTIRALTMTFVAQALARQKYYADIFIEASLFVRLCYLAALFGNFRSDLPSDPRIHYCGARVEHRGSPSFLEGCAPLR